ncbi:GNAT family N-acetyltransferase [Streptomyces sp. TLI_171]|uniref:GNAT family N-acetyltransferase n=1 Tax=Streptomyces sp. TLI_171 TaxID=1938859 RepID=UPI000C19E2B3|nr:GNAT family N-acetyltransferase [Streptomyces sp. TLI_171]RKE20690.1 acetyltransferase (GNAT) family protein [Streptomyces sp. TLI_171]
MSLRFELDPELTPALREEITGLWTDVSNAGGAVGFVPPVTAAEVRPVADRQFAALAPDRLLVGFEPGGRLAAVVFFEDMRFGLMDHWRLLKRVMVHPDFQGRGYGAELLAEAERVARSWGLAGLRLTLRGGHGLEKFYGRSGYVEVGRVPGAIRVGPGDDRDDVTMWLDLRA